MNPLPGLAGDWLIRETVVSLSSAGPFKLCSQDATRFALVMSNSAAAGANVAPALVDPTVTNGILLNTTVTFAAFTYRDYGAYVQQAWYAVRVTTVTNVYVAEILYRPTEPGAGITGLELQPEEELWSDISSLALRLSRLARSRESYLQEVGRAER